MKHLSDKYAVRALTRDATKPAAQRLVSLGAEAVSADFDDEASLTKAFAGADAIFGITNFWDQYSVETEVRQGLLVAKVASELPHLEHFIFSSLADATKLAGGVFKNVLPYNAKSAIRDGTIERYPELWAKTTTLFISFYYQNWLKYAAAFGPEKVIKDLPMPYRGLDPGCEEVGLTGLPPSQQADGSFALIQPYPHTAMLSAASSSDTGVLVAEILAGGAKYFQKTVSLVGTYVSVGELLKSWSESKRSGSTLL